MEKITLVTHSGGFQADEVFATAVLKKVFQSREITIIRSRNPEDWSKGDIVYDVGNGKYDHHMKNKPLRIDGQPYSSFGLIWRDYGRDYLINSNIKPEHVEEIYAGVDRVVVLPVDSHDNGVVRLRDHIVNAIDKFNPTWLDLLNRDETSVENEKFNQAVDFCSDYLSNFVRVWRAEIESREIIERSYDSNHPEVLILDYDLPWFQFALKQEKLLYVVYPSKGIWRMNAMNKPNSFETKKPLPESWGGLNNSDLEKVSGVPGATFCHPNLFTCGNRTKEGILEMLKLALN